MGPKILFSYIHNCIILFSIFFISLLLVDADAHAIASYVSNGNKKLNRMPTLHSNFSFPRTNLPSEMNQVIPLIHIQLMLQQSICVQNVCVCIYNKWHIAKWFGSWMSALNLKSGKKVALSFSPSQLKHVIKHLLSRCMYQISWTSPAPIFFCVHFFLLRSFTWSLIMNFY